MRRLGCQRRYGYGIPEYQQQADETNKPHGHTAAPRSEEGLHETGAPGRRTRPDLALLCSVATASIGTARSRCARVLVRTPSPGVRAMLVESSEGYIWYRPK